MSKREHEWRVRDRLHEGPMTAKGIAGGLVHWWDRSDCYDALARLVAREEVIQFDGRRSRYFALRGWNE